MTNYPFSIDSNKDYEKVVPFKLIGRRPGYDGGLVRFRFSGYEELIFPNADRVNVYLLIEIAPIFAIYQHQPIMRTIDYIIVQIVSLLREPEFLTMNAAVLAQKRQR
jgi:vacuolar protein sorting-associated protein 13A/C